MERQLCRGGSVRIHPEPDVLREYVDFFGNKVIYFSIEQEHGQLTVVVHSEIEKRAGGGREMNLYDNTTIETVKQHLSDDMQEAGEVSQYIFETPMTAVDGNIKAYARISFQ